MHLGIVVLSDFLLILVQVNLSYNTVMSIHVSTILFSPSANHAILSSVLVVYFRRSLQGTVWTLLVIV